MLLKDDIVRRRIRTYEENSTYFAAIKRLKTRRDTAARNERAPVKDLELSIPLLHLVRIERSGCKHMLVCSILQRKDIGCAQHVNGRRSL